MVVPLVLRAKARDDGARGRGRDGAPVDDGRRPRFRLQVFPRRGTRLRAARSAAEDARPSAGAQARSRSARPRACAHARQSLGLEPPHAVARDPEQLDDLLDRVRLPADAVTEPDDFSSFSGSVSTTRRSVSPRMAPRPPRRLDLVAHRAARRTGFPRLRPTGLSRLVTARAAPRTSRIWARSIRTRCAISSLGGPGQARRSANAPRASPDARAPPCRRACGSCGRGSRSRARSPRGSTRSRRSRSGCRAASRTSRPPGSGPRMPSWMMSSSGRLAVLVALRDRDDEPQVRVDHPVLGRLVPALDASASASSWSGVSSG